jgi:hypothetical protein
MARWGWTWAEPCVGAGDLLRPTAPPPLWTNDVDVKRDAIYHLNACHPSSWDTFPAVDWIVTNPPFNVAMAILRHALEHARVGVAMLLRLSFLEPVEDRIFMLENAPPVRAQVMPRIRFKGRGTDNVTCAWLFWGDADEVIQPGIFVTPKPRRLADIEGP